MLQIHLYDPSTLEHEASLWQFFFFSIHSSISVEKKDTHGHEIMGWSKCQILKKLLILFRVNIKIAVTISAERHNDGDKNVNP